MEDAKVACLPLTRPPQQSLVIGSLPVPVDPALLSQQSPACGASAAAVLLDRPCVSNDGLLSDGADLKEPPQAYPLFEERCSAAFDKAAGGPSLGTWGGGYFQKALARKGEALAVTGLAAYGSDMDVIAPADLLKQIFKVPYCKARLSVGVHRVGRTLVLNSGPEACQSNLREKPRHVKAMEKVFFSWFAMQSRLSLEDETAGATATSDFATKKLGHKGAPCESTAQDTIDKVEGEGHKKNKDSSESQGRPELEGFLRIIFWQFRHLRMLVGSDVLLFSSRDHSAISLHLMEIGAKVTPLMWLDAWLDNIMACVPELAICYHEDGVVQTFELLKTDEIYLLKGLAEDGTTFFHPHIVQENALSVFTFLQTNCTSDPGSYWLFKKAGDDVIKLFDLSVLAKAATSSPAASRWPLPSSTNGRGDLSLPLAMLLYRLALLLSSSQNQAERKKCGSWFVKSLLLIGEHDHPGVRAFAHEQVARLLLIWRSHCIGWIDEATFLESAKAMALSQPSNAETLQELSTLSSRASDQNEPDSQALRGGRAHHSEPADRQLSGPLQEADLPHQLSCISKSTSSNQPSSAAQDDSVSREEILSVDVDGDRHHSRDELTCEKDKVQPCTSEALPTARDDSCEQVAARLSAVHHISQAIKALQWQRHLLVDNQHNIEKAQCRTAKRHELPVCVCGEPACLPFSSDPLNCLLAGDKKLGELIMLLGESYFALAEAYKDFSELLKALRAAELAGLVCDSLQEKLSEKRAAELKFESSADRGSSVLGHQVAVSNVKQGPFWHKLWALVGDLYVEMTRDAAEAPTQQEDVAELSIPNHVVREVKRLRKKAGQERSTCSSCREVSCSCLSDRASSGNSASSSTESSTAGGGTARARRGQKRVDKEIKQKSNGRRRSTADDLPDVQETQASDPPSSEAQGLSASTITAVREEACEPAAGALTDVQKRPGDCLLEVGVGLFSSDITDACSSLAADSEGTSCCGPQERAERVPASTSSATAGQQQAVSCFGRPVTASWKINFAAAASCYAASAAALGEEAEAKEEREAALRKEGWASNELGRRYLACNQSELAEAAFEAAALTFKKVGDGANVALIFCNMGHGRRAAAEALVAAAAAASRASDTLSAAQEASLRSAASSNEARQLYIEALTFYSAAQAEVHAKKEGQQAGSTGVWREAHMQYAHTYLCLGMLLARQELDPGPDTQNGVLRAADLTASGRQGSRVRWKSMQGQVPERVSTADEAFASAISHYKVVGATCDQEVAYAQYLLACYHRDKAVSALVHARMAPRQQPVSSRPRTSMSDLDRVHKSAALADTSWEEALKYYKPEKYPDFFVDIAIERADLLLKAYFEPDQQKAHGAAFRQLLNTRRALTVKLAPDGSSKGFEGGLSVDVLKQLLRRLQSLLKDMLGAALKTSEARGPAQSQASPKEQAKDLKRLRDMYRQALSATEQHELASLLEAWTF
eukprot:SM000030S11361  [mRNA]  locus=s30:318829:325240:+ [translate_table: standard]